ncbi:hypothetical protein ONS95_000022 [Cadophora gregata]|uniref:uncharacterized protein n=1 Tax=Cadophora gregata TaxID=51156 RepID=UPI0026DB954C|nr:uncharacterized protein ONS95_000022 [Cadophora gregata]KAK0115718.1 hypothetical protein ONS96_014157 [Cadophora gregata f. sp. sojae]KAK0128036.1 hypothetical protein ONS95_000022 [Cadophora gregata]
MMSITRTIRQKLPSNLKAASSFSQTAVKTPPAASIHTVKLVHLHETLYASKEPKIQFRGLQIPHSPTCPLSSPALQDQARVTATTPDMLYGINPPARASIAGAAKKTISALISSSAEVQINKFRESHGRFQNKYLYGNPQPLPTPASSQKNTPTTTEPKATPTSEVVSEIKKDVAASVFGNKVKKAQRALGNEDLSNAFDL